MNKVYCENCGRYSKWDIVGEIVEYCFFTVEDYHSKEHVVRGTPKFTNATNKCKHYVEKNEDKNENK